MRLNLKRVELRVGDNQIYWLVKKYLLSRWKSALPFGYGTFWAGRREMPTLFDTYSVLGCCNSIENELIILSDEHNLCCRISRKILDGLDDRSVGT
jgi:hypothetical protein